ncbi:hypothetical protein LguiA_034302 [Lonicera macranthoides]
MASASSRAPLDWNLCLGDSHHDDPDDNPLLELKLYEDPWKIKKVLSRSDVNGSCRLLLSRKAVEEHVLSSMDENDARLCRTGRGKMFKVGDADDGDEHKLFLKKWANTKYFVLTGSWMRNFVIRKGLNVGDMIGLAWNGAQFHFKLLKRS